jgi:hypothetical protein
MIEEINSTTFTLFGEANIPFLHVVAIIHTLQDTEHRFFPATVLYRGIINGYIVKIAIGGNEYKNKQFSEDTVLQSFYNQVTLIQNLPTVKNRASQKKIYITKLEEHKSHR